MASIYLAGCFFEKENIRRYRKYLTTNGHIVTSNWTERENSTLDGSMVKDSDKKKVYADFDFDEIDMADIVVAILDNKEYAYRGTFTEIGYGIGCGKRVIIYCPGYETDDGFTHTCMENVFFHSSKIERYTNFDDVLTALQ